MRNETANPCGSRERERERERESYILLDCANEISAICAVLKYDEKSYM